ncbi:MAG: phospholipase D-like domain-containing protein [Psittacicella sp.]
MINLYISPYSSSTPIVNLINSSTKVLDINAYMITNTKIINAISKASKRGVKVYVILEEKPYFRSKSKRQAFVNKEISSLKKAGATIISSPSKFRFDHAKYICNNFECEFGTPNYTYNSFNKNREYYIVTSTPETVQTLHKLFQADYNNSTFCNTNSNLIISPGVTNDIIDLIKQPGKVYLEEEELGTDKSILSAIASKGANAELIIPASEKYYAKKSISYLTSYGVKIRYMPSSTYMHAKLIIGNNKGFLGSENLSYTSLNKNREVGTYITGNILEEAQNQFNKDWGIAKY